MRSSSEQAALKENLLPQVKGLSMLVFLFFVPVRLIENAADVTTRYYFITQVKKFYLFITFCAKQLYKKHVFLMKYTG